MRNNIQPALAAFLLGMILPAGVWAQGFQTLEDKYGQTSSLPVQQVPAEAPPATPATNPDPNAIPTEAPVTPTTPAANGPTPDKVPPGMVYIGGKEWDIQDMIKQVSRWTGKFFMESGVKGKVTIIADGYMPVDLAVQTFYSALESNGYTTYETPGGVIRVIKQTDAKTKPKDLFRDKTPIDADREALLSEKIITRVITPSNISANDIYSVIKDMISSFGTSFAYPPTNSIIISDTGANIDYILKLVKELDTSGPQETLEIIPIQNADAKDIADKIKTIFETVADDSGAAARRPAVSAAKKRTGSTGTELQDVQALSQVIADERTNSVILMGTKRMIMRIRGVISKLDRALAGGEGSLHVYTLKYAKAEELEETLNKLVNGTSSSSKDKKNSKSKTTASKETAKETSTTNTSTVSNAVELEGGIKVVADVPTNQLIITATPKDYDTLVEQVIAKLDVPRPSVYLEVVIMSMDVKKATTLGLSGLFGGVIGSLAGSDLTAFGGILPTTPSAIAAIAAASGGLGAGVVSQGTIEFTDSSGNTTSIPSVSTILQALNANTDVNVIATPSLLTLDKEDAVFEVGQNVPFITGGALSASDVSSFSVEREKVGTELKITPQVSGKETVRLDITQVISNVFSESDKLGPTLDEKTVDTTIVAKDKQTIVIAGIMDDKSSVSMQKVPLLGDIPVLGNLFSNKVTEKTKSSLLVFITPYIIRESADNLAILKKKIDERNAFMDLNFGKKQRKQIRQAIELHAKDLLEFKCTPTDMSNPCFTDASYSEKEQAIPATTTEVTDQKPAEDKAWDPRTKKKK